MKTLFVFLVCLSFSGLGALALVSQSFDTSTGFPYGWTKSPDITNWSWVATNLAGGSAGELRLMYDPAQPTGTLRFISPAFDTRKVHNMRLSFNHYLDDYEYSYANYTVGVAISNNNGSSWTTIWSVTTTGDIFPAAVTVDPISFDKGMAQYTRICFFFTGTIFDDIDAWYIDNILLTYDNTLGSGTWTGYQFYDIVGNLIVPNGHTLTLPAGCELIFDGDKYFEVQGRLLINGNENGYVGLTTVSTAVYWAGLFLNGVNPANDSTLINYAYISQSSGGGISIYDTDKVRISYCIITDNIEGYGAGIYAHNSDIIIEGCDIYDNEADGTASGLYCLNSTPTVRYNKIYHNYCEAYGSAFLLTNCNVSNVTGNVIANNFFTSNGYGVTTTSTCTGQFRRNLIANNQNGGLAVNGNVDVINCDVVNNGGYGIAVNVAETDIISSIVWGNGSSEVFNIGIGADLEIYYSCIQDHDVAGNGIPGYQYLDNISSNPVFISPTAGTGTGYYALSADWHLQWSSPCIDTGDPGATYDPDGSRADMGVYPASLKPVITRAQDYSPDQGHQLDLKWNQSDTDKSGTFGDYYSIWREGESRSGDVLYLNRLTELTPALAESGREIAWRDGTRTWYFLLQVPGLGFSDYGYLVPTPQDSSSTGTHACNYMVAYDVANAGTWLSGIVGGYTVDNIPPSAPARLDIAQTGTSSINLFWDEVTGGYLNGVFEEELNAITYKVYADDIFDFVPGPSSFLMSTTDPFAVLLNQTADHKFYKITASDSE